MITLNNIHFAANEQEFTNSLFNAKGTASGYYKPLTNRIDLLDHNKVKVGIISKSGVLALATQPECLNGKWHYSYGDIALIGRYDSYTQQCNEVKEALTLLKGVGL